MCGLRVVSVFREGFLGALDSSRFYNALGPLLSNVFSLLTFPLFLEKQNRKRTYFLNP